MATSFGEVFRQSDEQHRETPFPTLPEGTGPNVVLTGLDGRLKDPKAPSR